MARDLGVNENSLHHWKKRLEEDEKDAFRGHGKLKAEDEELRRLRRELQIAKEERDILKKAIAFFARHGK